ncbi:Hypothetical predicted protein, partial [Pelobates cultripes]
RWRERPPASVPSREAEDLDGDLMPPISSSVSRPLLYTSDPAALITARERLSASVKPFVGDCPRHSESVECPECTEPPSNAAALAASIPPL